MDYATAPAFALSLPAHVPRRACLRASSFAATSARARPFLAMSRGSRAASFPRMQASDPESNPAPEPPAAADAAGSSDAADGTTSATEILETLRAESAADDTPSERSMLGVYRDVDGKSNVWAVEPEEKTDTGPQISKTTIIVAAAAFIVVALLVLPLLPFTNPDQL